MVFSDLLFIFVFLPLFALTYLLGAWLDKIRNNRAETEGEELNHRLMWRNIALVIFSLIFYSWGEPIYVFLMLISVCINYVCGLGIEKSRHSKPWLIVGVALDLGILGTFKYLGLFAETLSGIGIPVSDPGIALPIGISFYIFQSISYLVDVYRKESPAQHNYLDLLLYISMFPQLIAGPIVRYGTIAEEINHRRVDSGDVAQGSYRFFIGLAKKVIFANILGEIATQLLGGDLTDLSTAGAWVGIAAFSLQIYFDFSGYSDMAIGLGRSVGFHFPENFRHPYTCTSMTDFWRKWHISLGSFFRDYVYIPMGGNRRHQALNIMVVWMLTGFWHGASWNFLFWGLYFGVIITIEKYTLLKWRVPRVLLHLYCLPLLLISWAMFYFEDFGRMQQFYHAMFGMGASQGIPMSVESAVMDNLWLWVFAIILCMPVREKIARFADRKAIKMGERGEIALQACRAVISIAIIITSVALLVGATNNAFIYTRF